MIKKDELYEVTVTASNIEHYRQFYPEIKIRSKIQVTGEQLPNSSHTKVKFICDFCGAEYERVKYSEIRSGELNACPKCKNQKTKKTCQEKYGKDHPMQVAEIHQRSVKGHINNFGKEANGCGFSNGVPVSKVQKTICEELKDFTLNYLENGYYYDMFNKNLNLVIEYNGRGHDLQVRRGKISREKFNAKEIVRIQDIRKNHRLIIIEDSHDRLIHPKRFLEAMIQIRQAISDLKDFQIIQIE